MCEVENNFPDQKRSGSFSRRNSLLAGTPFIAAAGVQAAAPMITARAQQATPATVQAISSDEAQVIAQEAYIYLYWVFRESNG